MSTSKTEAKNLFENSYIIVDEEGTLYIKATSYTDKRKIAELDTEKDIAGQLVPYQNQFKELAEKKKEVLASAGTNPTQEFRAKIDALIEEFKSSLLAGDIEHELEDLIATREKLAQAGAESPTPSPGASQTDDPETTPEEPAETEDNSPLQFYIDLTKKAEDLARQTDWPYVDMELNNLQDKWVEEGPEIEENKQEVFEELSGRFKKARVDFDQRKKEHYEKLNEQKQKNLEKKRTLLNELKEIVEAKQWKAIKKVEKISSRFSSVAPVPKKEDEELDKKFQKLYEIFEEHKVDLLVQKKEAEKENLVGKLAVLDKMEALITEISEETADWNLLDERLKQLKRQWQKIGRVPQHKNREVWDRYKKAQDDYYNQKFKFNSDFRKRIEKSLKKKIALCEEAEALLDKKDLSKAARQINRLHKRWKKAGNLPQKEENELWDRFKAATDAFNQRKSENIDLLKEQEEKHYKEKLNLIEQAEEIKDTTEWQSGADKMQHLMKRWKEIGPVPRSKNKKIWKKFKGAMDHFYDRRREHFRNVKEEYKKNLKAKETIIEKLEALGSHDDPIKAVEEAKKLQNEFKDIGFVPIKKKNKIWKQYRKACDVIYDRFRAAKSNKATTNVLEAKGYEKEEIEIIQTNKKKLNTLRKRANALNDQIIQHKEAKTYFKPSGQGNKFIEELQQKIDKAEEELVKIEREMEACEQRLDAVKND